MKKSLAAIETLLRNKCKTKKFFKPADTASRFNLHDSIRKNRKSRIDRFK